MYWPPFAPRVGEGRTRAYLWRRFAGSTVKCRVLNAENSMPNFRATKTGRARVHLFQKVGEPRSSTVKTVRFWLLDTLIFP